MRTLRRILFGVFLALIFAPALADVAFQNIDERQYYTFTYPSGEYRMTWNNTIIAMKHGLSDTTGQGVLPSGTLDTYIDGDSVGLFWWDDDDITAPFLFYFIETTGTDSIFTHPQYQRMNTKLAPPASVDSAAILDDVIDSAHLADSLINIPDFIKSRTIKNIHLGISCVDADQIAASAIDSTKVADGKLSWDDFATDGAGRVRMTTPLFGISAAAGTLGVNVIRPPANSDSNFVRVDAQGATYGDLKLGAIIVADPSTGAQADSITCDVVDLPGIFVDDDSTVIKAEATYSTRIRVNNVATDIDGDLDVENDIVAGAGVTATGTVQGEHLKSTDDADIDDDLNFDGAITRGGVPFLSGIHTIGFENARTIHGVCITSKQYMKGLTPNHIVTFAPMVYESASGPDTTNTHGYYTMTSVRLKPFADTLVVMGNTVGCDSAQIFITAVPVLVD